MNAFEFTFCHNDFITKFELDIIRSYRNDMLILNRGEMDKIVHSSISNSKRWITVWGVLAMDCMVKVVAE